MASAVSAAVPAASPVSAPGPGAWELESTHLNRPLSRWMVAVHCPAFERGFSDGTRHYGMLLERFETAVVDGFLYICPRAVGAPKGAKGPPPRVIFTLLTWLHPEIRRRNRRMAEVFATKAWREDLRRWDEDWKPAIARDLTALQAVDPTKLGDAELATHLETCRVAVDLAIWRHHRLNPCAMIALGDYLSQVGAWSGLPASDLLAPLR
nr:hypothetical protein [Planctomycetota bacterium]